MSGIKINGNLNEGGIDVCIEVNKMDKKGGQGHLGIDSEGNRVDVNGMEKNNGNGMEKTNENEMEKIKGNEMEKINVNGMKKSNRALMEENVTISMKEPEKSIFNKFVNGSFFKGK